jgi:hypothetical protein
MKDKIELDWISRWKGLIGNPSRKPHWVMKAYIDLLDMLVDNLEEAMCWECLPEDNEPEEIAESA